ncbi:hypothetical protein D3C78_1660600 [compost metagenome]
MQRSCSSAFNTSSLSANSTHMAWLIALRLAVLSMSRRATWPSRSSVIFPVTSLLPVTQKAGTMEPWNSASTNLRTSSDW